MIIYDNITLVYYLRKLIVIFIISAKSFSIPQHYAGDAEFLHVTVKGSEDL